MSPVPSTLFGQFALHFLGISAACLLVALVLFAYPMRRRMSTIATVWLASTALVSLFVLAAATFGATVLIASVVVDEIEGEFRERPEYLRELPAWKRRPQSDDTTQPEDIQ